MKNRGIKISVLYIPYVPINPVNTSFASDEDDYANNNIPNIPASLQGCASPSDSSGSYFYNANTPAGHQRCADGDVQSRADGRAHHQLDSILYRLRSGAMLPASPRIALESSRCSRLAKSCAVAVLLASGRLRPCRAADGDTIARL